jgi:D-proline reductase (dithiol) PrdB
MGCYQWAHHAEAPFSQLTKPLSECKIGLIGTSEVAVRFDPETEADPIVEEDFRGIYSIPADIPSERFYSRTASFDQNATHLEDVNAYYPIDQMRAAIADGRVG